MERTNKLEEVCSLFSNCTLEWSIKNYKKNVYAFLMKMNEALSTTLLFVCRDVFLSTLGECHRQRYRRPSFTTAIS